MTEFQIDLQTKLGQKLLHMDMEKDLKPRLWLLTKNIGVDYEEVGSYLTRNPYFLIQKISDIQVCLKFHKFNRFLVSLGLFEKEEIH